MHVVVCWNIRSVAMRQHLNNSMKVALNNYSWVRPLPYFYIVEINTVDDRELIKKSLVEVAKNNLRKIHFVISPAIENGHYSGWLPKKLWDSIARRTEKE